MPAPVGVNMGARPAPLTARACRGADFTWAGGPGGKKAISTNKCPNCGRSVGGAITSLFYIYECCKYGRLFCKECGDDRCPDCGSKDKRDAGYAKG